MLISPLSPTVPFFFLFVKHCELAYFYYNKIMLPLSQVCLYLSTIKKPQPQNKTDI